MPEFSEAEAIYLKHMREVKVRLSFSELQLRAYGESNDICYLENAILHLRKTLETIMYAAIAPNKKKYAELRSKAEKPSDYRKDYNASKILLYLSKINKDFYPIPVQEPTLVTPGNWHFERVQEKFLNKKQFGKIYDRLGKFLHADNPWDHDKGYENISKELLDIYSKIMNLLRFHFIRVIDKKDSHLWGIEMCGKNESARIFKAFAEGEFVIE
jgi:hypothetical protein